MPDYPGDVHPLYVHVKEASTASWAASAALQNWTHSGQANNGIGGPYLELPGADGKSATGTCTSVRTSQLAISPDVNSFTVGPVSLNASITAGCQFMGVQDSVNISYTVSTYDIHDHPINFRLKKDPPDYDDPHLTILCFYIWDCTNGKTFSDWLADHTAFQNIQGTIREYVTYSGDITIDTTVSPFGWQASSPPWSPSENGHIPNTDIQGISAANPTEDGLRDSNWTPTDFVHAYRTSIINANQTWQFHCPVCMLDGEYETLLGPIEIVRRIYQGNVFQTWQALITKHGSTATIVLPRPYP